MHSAECCPVYTIVSTNVNVYALLLQRQLELSKHGRVPAMKLVIGGC